MDDALKAAEEAAKERGSKKQIGNKIAQ